MLWEQEKLGDTLTVSDRKDDISFRISIKTDGKEPRHIILTDQETGKKVLGKFIFSDIYPDEEEGRLKGYGQDQQDISEDVEDAIIYWAYEQSNRFDVNIVNNWEAINAVWYALNVLPYTEW